MRHCAAAPLQLFLQVWQRRTSVQISPTLQPANRRSSVVGRPAPPRTSQPRAPTFPWLSRTTALPLSVPPHMTCGRTVTDTDTRHQVQRLNRLLRRRITATSSAAATMARISTIGSTRSARSAREANPYAARAFALHARAVCPALSGRVPSPSDSSIFRLSCTPLSAIRGLTSGCSTLRTNHRSGSSGYAPVKASRWPGRTSSKATSTRRVASSS